MSKYKGGAYLRLSYSANHSVESDSSSNQKKLIPIGLRRQER